MHLMPYGLLLARAEEILTRKSSHWAEDAQRRGMKVSMIAGAHIALYASLSLVHWSG